MKARLPNKTFISRIIKNKTKTIMNTIIIKDIIENIMLNIFCSSIFNFENKIESFRYISKIMFNLTIVKFQS